MGKEEGYFKKGNIPWNKGKRKLTDLNLIVKRYFDEEKSTREIGAEFCVSQKTVENILKEKGHTLRRRGEHTQRTKTKISKTLKRKGIEPIERYSGEVWNKGLTKNDKRVWKNIQGLLKNRKTQVMPIKDTSIEVKMQKLLGQLGIEFYTHQYMKIKHGYQCDIMIPVQKGIHKKTIIECFGDYWHKHPLGREIDVKRCIELREKGWRVLVFWEREIKPMRLNNLREVLLR